MEVGWYLLTLYKPQQAGTLPFQTCGTSLSAARTLLTDSTGHQEVTESQGSPKADRHHYNVTSYRLKGLQALGANKFTRKTHVFQNSFPLKAYLQHCPCATTEALGCTPHSSLNHKAVVVPLPKPTLLPDSRCKAEPKFTPSTARLLTAAGAAF